MNFYMPQRFSGGPGMGGFPRPQAPWQMPYGSGAPAGLGMPKPSPLAPPVSLGGFNGGMGIPRPQPMPQFGGPVEGGMQGVFHPGGGAGVPLSALRQYKNGTPYVPRTGPAIVHEGEMIIPANKAKKVRKVALSSLLKLK